MHGQNGQDRNLEHLKIEFNMATFLCVIQVIVISKIVRLLDLQ